MTLAGGAAYFLFLPLVCDAGITSNRAVTSLRKQGLESVYGLKGGIAAWTQANLPLFTGKKTKGKNKK